MKLEVEITKERKVVMSGRVGGIIWNASFIPRGQMEHWLGEELWRGRLVVGSSAGSDGLAISW